MSLGTVLQCKTYFFTLWLVAKNSLENPDNGTYLKGKTQTARGVSLGREEGVGRGFALYNSILFGSFFLNNERALLLQ